ncbi:MAG: hypothetical protein KKF89_00760 [Nanoarchaeota archaeon]|nr:hypothetical protein [Nanoarchaeota archaeon]MBU1854227.1 hypothetical protein [Nanoarchaeota archaeon]
MTLDKEVLRIALEFNALKNVKIKVKNSESNGSKPVSGDIANYKSTIKIYKDKVSNLISRLSESVTAVDYELVRDDAKNVEHELKRLVNNIDSKYRSRFLKRIINSNYEPIFTEAYKLECKVWRIKMDAKEKSFHTAYSN